MTDIPVENWIRKPEGEYFSDKELIPQNGKYNDSNPTISYQNPSHGGIIPAIFDDGMFLPFIFSDTIDEVNFEITVKVHYASGDNVAVDVFRYYVVVVNGDVQYPDSFLGENWTAYQFTKGDCGDTTVEPGQLPSCVVTGKDGVPHREIKSNWIPIDDLKLYEDEEAGLDVLSRDCGYLVAEYAAGDVGYDGSGSPRDTFQIDNLVAKMMDALTDAYFDGTNPYGAVQQARKDLHFYLDDFIDSASEQALDRLIFSMEEEVAGGFTFVIQNNANGIAGSDGSDVIIGSDGRDNIGSSGGDDALYGDGGKDKLVAWKGKDLLDGGSGNDKMYGGKGKDGFNFAKGYDKDVIFDFKTKNEKIYIDDSVTTRWKKLKKVVEDYKKGAQIDLGGGDVLKLKGVEASDLKKKNFEFVDFDGV